MHNKNCMMVPMDMLLVARQSKKNSKGQENCFDKPVPPFRARKKRCYVGMPEEDMLYQGMYNCTCPQPFISYYQRIIASIWKTTLLDFLKHDQDMVALIVIGWHYITQIFIKL